MERILLPIMIQDPSLSGIYKQAEGFYATEPYYLDGPVSERVAVIDFDEKTGAVLPGAKYIKERRRKTGYFVDEENRPIRFRNEYGKFEYRLETRAFNQVSVFATVLRTMAIFEDEEVLGRQLHWSFDSPQLLVIPRAGVWANAYYDRNTHSLQFFYFKDRNTGEWVYSSLSRDIVSHETAHAILDGIAPDLYDAITPQSQALHETIADLTAVIMALKSHNLVLYIIKQNQGDITQSTEFSRIGEQFGRAIKKKRSEDEDTTKPASLRELSEIKSFDKTDHKPHRLSVSLSAALYNLLVQMYEDWWDIETKRAQQENIQSFVKHGRRKHKDPKISGAHEALRTTVDDFSKMVLGALDYLPPGEISFADFGRAMFANQQNLHHFTAVPRDERQRAKKRIDWLIERFEQAGIIDNERTIREMPIVGNPLVKTHFEHKALKELNLDELIQSDWMAYQFANDHRRLLGIPRDIPFEIHPRLAIKKQLFETKDDTKIYQNQIIFKASWEKLEKNVVSVSGFPRSRRIKVGTTLVIDRDSQTIIARLHTDDDSDLEIARTRMITKLQEDKLLRFEDESVGPHGETLQNFVQADQSNEVLHLSGVSRLLHIIDTEEAG